MTKKRRRIPRTLDPKEVEAWRRGMLTDESEKMDKAPEAEEGNLPIFDDEGQVEDSGESPDTIRARAYFYGRCY